MTPKQWTTAARVFTLGAACCGAVYLGGRFDLVTLPREGCSPVQRYSPGSRLLIDRWAPEWVEGDCVFVADSSGVIHLVLLSEERAGEGWWTETDAKDCPGVDPSELGWVAEERLLGRVVLSLAP